MPCIVVIESGKVNMITALSIIIVFHSRTIYEAHKHTVTIGGHRIHALLQSTFEVRLIIGLNVVDLEVDSLKY